MKNSEIEKLVRRIVKKRQEISDKRDELRKMCSDFEAVLESLDDADESFQLAVEHLHSGLDTMSQYL